MIKKYQKFVNDMNITRDGDYNCGHVIFGLIEEVGELAGVYKRLYRGDYQDEEFNRHIEKEMGDILFYYFAAADLFGLNVKEIMRSNMKKLKDRKERGVIKGKGDNR